MQDKNKLSENRRLEQYLPNRIKKEFVLNIRRLCHSYRAKRS